MDTGNKRKRELTVVRQLTKATPQRHHNLEKGVALFTYLQWKVFGCREGEGENHPEQELVEGSQRLTKDEGECHRTVDFIRCPKCGETWEVTRLRRAFRAREG